jgi:glycosyltransferase involved in cell wall biosynthesis
MAVQTRQLADLLAGEGVAVTIVQVNAPYSPAWIGHVKGLRAIARLVPYLRRLWRDCAGMNLVHVMANSGWSWHLYAAPAVWIARLRGVPVVVNYRGGEAASFLERSVRWVRPSLEAASLLAVPSDFLRGVFRQHDIDAYVLPNIVDLSRFRFALRAPNDAPHLVITRNLEGIYDIPTALEAFARVLRTFPKARLSIAGSGPERSNLEARIAALGIAQSVSFAGKLDRDQVAALYRDADFMLNPSRVDNMPNSVLEALACGLPVVSTRAGGVPHIVKDGVSALLVDVGDAEGMAAAVVRLVRDADLRRRIVEAGFADVQEYTWARVSERLGELYARVLPANLVRMTAA